MNIRIAMLAMGLVLSGCASVADNGSPASNMVGMATDAISPGAREEYRAKQDDAKCRDFGYQPQTKPYADCRMELERLHAGARPVTVRVQ
jgi:hypothetical protein